MKTTIHILLITVLFSNISFAQGEKHMQKRKEIMKKQIEFVISELQLTEKEKKEFIPVFKEYNSKKEELFMQKRKRMRNFHKNNLNMTKAELLDLADFLVENDVEIAKLGKEYNEKFKTILPPIKIILFHKAEQQFKMKLFRQMKQKGMGQKMHP